MFLSFYDFMKRPMCDAIEKFIEKFEDISSDRLFRFLKIKLGGILFCEGRKDLGQKTCMLWLTGSQPPRMLFSMV